MKCQLPLTWVVNEQLIVEVFLDVILNVNIESRNRMKVLSGEAVADQRPGNLGHLPVAAVVESFQGLFGKDVRCLIGVVFKFLIGQWIDGFLEDRIRAKREAGEVHGLIFSGTDTSHGGLLLVLPPSSADLNEEGGTADQESGAFEHHNGDVSHLHLHYFACDVREPNPEDRLVTINLSALTFGPKT